MQTAGILNRKTTDRYKITNSYKGISQKHKWIYKITEWKGL